MAHPSSPDGQPPPSPKAELFDSKPASYWYGVMSECEHEHHSRSDDDDEANWLLLGRDTQPSSFRLWLPEHRLPYLGRINTAYALLKYELLLESLGMSEAELREKKYVMKVPTYDNPFPIHDESRFDWHLSQIFIDQIFNSSSCCPDFPFVILICTKEQFDRCSKEGWPGSVQREHERWLRDGANSDKTTELEEGSEPELNAHSARATTILDNGSKNKNAGPKRSFKWKHEKCSVGITIIMNDDNSDKKNSGPKNSSKRKRNTFPARITITIDDDDRDDENAGPEKGSKQKRGNSTDE